MRVAVSGASGLVGSALSLSLREDGHTVVPLVRRKGHADPAILWDPLSEGLAPEALRGIDALVHLAGESVASGRWTSAKKAAIRDSRVKGTQLLCQALCEAGERGPKIWVCASAVGYYGSCGAEELAEDASPGSDFLARVCEEWEAASQPAIEAGVRVVNLRIGVVLSRDGGALAKMLVPFKLGLGGVVGSGAQYMSWVYVHDLVRAIRFCIDSPDARGPYNAVAPNPVTNREFTRQLGAALRRPTFFPLPAFVARIAFGEMADALLLSSTRVLPKRLQEAGFAFQHPHLTVALREILG